MYAPSYERLAPRLVREFPGIGVFTMDESGKIKKEGKEVDLADMTAEISWASHPVVHSPMRDEFVHVVLNAPHMKWIQTPAAGTDDAVFRHFFARGLRVTRSDESGIAIAEFIMARVMEVFHPVFERAAAQARGDWMKFDFREIHGTTWLIMGFGNIGSRVGERARAFGARVIGMRRHPGSSPHADLMIAPEEVLSHLPEIDVVVSTLPGKSDTTGFINEAFLSRMKENSVLVNIGRGVVVDEEALLKALDRGTPSMAVLDVFRTEPLPAGSPFWKHPRVRLTAHVANGLTATAARAGALFLRNLRRYLDKQPLELEITPEQMDR
jgi:phosphoglycerate dehydrogenase-like enzyme